MDTCFSAKIMDSVIEWGIEQDNMITIYHNQLKKLYFRTCLFMIDELRDYCDRNREGWIEEKNKLIERGGDQEDIDDADEMIEANVFKPSVVKDKIEWLVPGDYNFNYYYSP